MMDGRAEPDQPARAYFKAIADDPEAVRREPRIRLDDHSPNLHTPNLSAPSEQIAAQSST